MTKTYISSNVVVIARDHNPSILHPSFVKSQGVVPHEWELLEDSISTPPFARIAFRNGISITVQQHRLEVSDNLNTYDVSSTPISDVAKSYIQTLPHVEYCAVGLNFRLLSEKDEPGAHILNTFIADGPWKTKLGAETASATIFYPRDRWRLKVELSAGYFAESETNESHIGIVLDANYHQEINEKDKLAAASDALDDRLNQLYDLDSKASVIIGE